MFSDIPPDLHNNILVYLNPKDLFQFSLSCKKFRQISYKKESYLTQENYSQPDVIDSQIIHVKSLHTILNSLSDSTTFPIYPNVKILDLDNVPPEFDIKKYFPSIIKLRICYNDVISEVCFPNPLKILTLRLSPKQRIPVAIHPCNIKRITSYTGRLRLFTSTYLQYICCDNIVNLEDISLPCVKTLIVENITGKGYFGNHFGSLTKLGRIKFRIDSRYYDNLEWIKIHSSAYNGDFSMFTKVKSMILFIDEYEGRETIALPKSLETLHFRYIQDSYRVLKFKFGNNITSLTMSGSHEYGFGNYEIFDNLKSLSIDILDDVTYEYLSENLDKLDKLRNLEICMFKQLDDGIVINLPVNVNRFMLTGDNNKAKFVLNDNLEKLEIFGHKNKFVISQNIRYLKHINYSKGLDGNMLYNNVEKCHVKDLYLDSWKCDKFPVLKELIIECLICKEDDELMLELGKDVRLVLILSCYIERSIRMSYEGGESEYSYSRTSRRKIGCSEFGKVKIVGGREGAIIKYGENCKDWI